MKKQNLSLLIVVRSANKKTGLAKTFIRITIDGDQTECYIGELIPKYYWDDEKKECRHEYSNHRFVNERVNNALEEIKAHYLVLSKMNDSVRPEDVKNAYKGIVNKKKVQSDACELNKPKSLLNIADEFITTFEKLERNGKRSEGRLRHWRNNRKIILEFIAFQYRKEDLFLHEIKSTFADDLYMYLTLEREDYLADMCHKRRNINLSEVTAKKRIKDIKQLIDIGVEQEIISKNPIDKFCTSGGEQEVLPLELHDIHVMYNKKISIPRLCEIRDVYVFQCFTGFAYQDLSKLTRENISYVGAKGEAWLIKERGKTGVSEMVPLLPIALDIIEKYKSHPYCKATGKLLPVISNTNYNAYLKEVADICGVNRVLKTHLARHTFADLMLNVCNIPLEDVSSMMGHKSIRTTMQYCRIRKERISRNMKEGLKLIFYKSGKLKLNSDAA